MKFDLLSDLHIDINREFFLPDKNEGSDILVVAGDLAEYRSLLNLHYKPFHEMMKQYNDVVYVAGNHEFYGANYQAVVNRFRDDLGIMYEGHIHFLHGDTWEVPDSDVAFVGGTLFTDMNGGDELAMKVVRQCMADFTYITYNDNNPLALGDRYQARICRPEDYVHEHKHMLLKFENECDRLADKKVVLVTHHAMSEKSVTYRYSNDHLMNAGYRSHLEWFFEKHKNVHVHCHGHMHEMIRYEIANARIYCNPCGYTKYGETRVNYGPLQIEV